MTDNETRKTDKPRERRRRRDVPEREMPIVAVAISPTEQAAQNREMSIREIRRTLAKCRGEMERGRERFTIVCDPAHVDAVRQYLTNVWGVPSPDVKQALIVTARRTADNGKGAER